MLKILSNFLRLAAFGGALATGVQAQDASGAYIAARQAAMAHDYQPASQYFARALSQSPQNLALVAQAMSAFLAVGDVDKAQILAKMLTSSSETQPLAEIL